MTAEQKYAEAIARIKEILADDKNYQANSLKLGGIWDVCDRHAEYRRGIGSDYQLFVEVLPR